MPNPRRVAAATLVVSAATLVTIAANEGYQDRAYKDVVGVETIGFGETKGVEAGQKTTVQRALVTLLDSADDHAKGMVACIHVPITQYEFDSYLDFTYNVGVQAFCSSTLNKKLNNGDYIGACKELLRWDMAGGRHFPGLTKRRQMEYDGCIGNPVRKS